MHSSNSPALGRLFALGVGPGASDLVTLRTLNRVQRADVIAIPKKNADENRSFAWEILEGALAAPLCARKLWLWFPMSKNPAVTLPAWRQAVEQIVAELEAGRDVAFITEGDPSVYSTWSYLLAALPEQCPGLEIEVVPAVSSITAIPAVTRIPLADGEERFCVVPATYGIEMLPRLVQEFDSILLIKAGRMIPQLVSLLEELDLLDKATYVAHATTGKQEVIEDLRSLADDDIRYFSMVQISIRTRKGILGRTPEALAQAANE